MKPFLSAAISSILASCASFPAHAEEPLPPDVAMMANAKTERVSVDRKVIEAISQYLDKAQFESVRMCMANNQLWFCQAQGLLRALQKDVKPILEEAKAEEDKQEE